MYDLQLWEKVGTDYRHAATIIVNQPYAICKAQKKNQEANSLAHFQFLKIVKNA
jgi:hypothetical protein